MRPRKRISGYGVQLHGRVERGNYPDFGAVPIRSSDGPWTRSISSVEPERTCAEGWGLHGLRRCADPLSMECGRRRTSGIDGAV